MHIAKSLFAVAFFTIGGALAAPITEPGVGFKRESLPEPGVGFKRDALTEPGVGFKRESLPEPGVGF